MLCSSLMNFLGLWSPDCFPSGVLAASGKGAGVVGTSGADGVAWWFPVIISGATADPESNWQRNKDAANNFCTMWKVRLKQIGSSQKFPPEWAKIKYEEPAQQSIWIRCVWCNNLRIDSQCQRASPVSACLALTWTQDMQTDISGKPADTEGCRRGRAEIKLCHTWTTAVSPRADRGESCVPRSCSEPLRGKRSIDRRCPNVVAWLSILQTSQVLSERCWLSRCDYTPKENPDPSFCLLFFMICLQFILKDKQNQPLTKLSKRVTADRTVSWWDRLYHNSFKILYSISAVLLILVWFFDSVPE